MRPVHVLGLVLLSCIWGSAYMFMRASVPAFGAVPMIFLRMALASALVLLPLLWFRGQIGMLRTHWRAMALVGIVFTALPFVSLGYASHFLSAGTIAIIQACAPIFAAAVAHIWWQQKITGIRALGLLVGMCGVVLLVWDKISLADGAGISVLLTLAATALWGVASNYTRERLAHVDPLALAAGSLSWAAVLLAPGAFWYWPVEAPNTKAWLEILFLGVIGSGLGFFLYFLLIQKVGALRTVSVTFLNPIVALLSAAAYLGEPITLHMLLACAITLVGTAITLGLLGPIRKPLSA